MARHLSEKFGEIAEYYHLDYDIESLLARLGFNKVQRQDKEVTLLSLKENVSGEMDNIFEDIEKQKGSGRQKAGAGAGATSEDGEEEDEDGV